MGCHTWFGRPITNEELYILKDEANKALLQEYNNASESEYLLNTDDYNRIKDAISKNDLKAICEIGTANYEDFIWFAEGKPCLDLSYRWSEEDKEKYCIEDCLPELFHIDKNFYHDMFRVDNYPDWVIHNKRQLRRKMKKRYFKLTQEELYNIGQFFKDYPGGVITFG